MGLNRQFLNDPYHGGTLPDAYLHGIYDAEANLIPGTPHDDFGDTNGSRVVFRASENGTYYVAAGATLEYTGTYTVSVKDVTDSISDDFALGPGTNGTVDIGGTVSGRVNFAVDRDWFAVSLEASKTYKFELEGKSTQAGTLSDPALHGVYDSDDNLIANTTNDDGGGGWAK